MTEAKLEPLFISVREAAGVLGLSLSVTYGLCDAGQIVTKYAGRRRLVNFESLRKYADSLPDYPQTG